MRERLRFPLYDTWRLATGAIGSGTVLDYFTTPKGSVGSGYATAKNELQTNLTTAGQMPYNVFRVVGVRLFCYSLLSVPTVIGDLNQILTNFVFNFKKEDRTILSIPAHWIPSGIGITGYTTNATKEFVSNGMPVMSNLYRVLPETYTTGDRIQIDLTSKVGTTMSADVHVAVMLEGVVDKKF